MIIEDGPVRFIEVKGRAGVGEVGLGLEGEGGSLGGAGGDAHARASAAHAEDADDGAVRTKGAWASWGEQ